MWFNWDNDSKSNSKQIHISGENKMNGLFGFGWIDTLVKLIIFVLVGIMVTLIKLHYAKCVKTEVKG